MRIPLLWKLFGLNLLTIGVVVGIVWGAVDYLAADYFSVLMEKYHISPTDSHAMFLASIHRYLIWGSVCAVGFSVVISYFVMRRILTPLTQMTQITGRIAAGDFSAKVPAATRDEVGQLARSFNHMSESLNHMEKLRKTMLVDAAHELKTPLTNIQGYVEALMDEMVPSSQETFELLKVEAERLSRLVSDMLELARAGSAKLSLDIMKIKMAEAINTVYEVFRLRLTTKNIAVDLNLVDNTGLVYGDPHKVAQILYNLFENAWQYTPAGGRLRIETQNRPAAVRTIFTNTQTGLRPEDVSLIFERFYRGEKSRSREYGGAGIGLAVVKELVEAHQGQTGALLEDGEFQVWFSLPNHPPE